MSYMSVSRDFAGLRMRGSRSLLADLPRGIPPVLLALGCLVFPPVLETSSHVSSPWQRQLCMYVRMYVCVCMYVCMYVCMHLWTPRFLHNLNLMPQ